MLLLLPWLLFWQPWMPPLLALPLPLLQLALLEALQGLLQRMAVLLWWRLCWGPSYCRKEAPAAAWAMAKML